MFFLPLEKRFFLLRADFRLSDTGTASEEAVCLNQVLETELSANFDRSFFAGRSNENSEKLKALIEEGR